MKYLKRSYSDDFESSYDLGLNLKVKNSVLDKLFDPTDTVTNGLDAISGKKEVGSENSFYISANQPN
ncbi:unnamed protein product [Bursaphelenchus okinawaensis]|uniref:Uncharacterized protein n=1 Tax=Bursaphelenchus okinawaensis TaxID=465554 RepID=A0A811L495_9BILA|nr:unnamed protein product [Bursaphelenchus okinawaensis]CAG9119240.1 unnamed protein product [Bursaphelenchus okinawaensis]